MDKLFSLKQIAKGAGIAFIGMVIGRIFAYLYTILIARMGPSSYGTISIALSIISFGMLFSLLGLEAAELRYVSYYHGQNKLAKIKGTITSALKISLPLSLVICVMLILFSDFIGARIFHNEQLSLILKIFALILPFSVFTKICLAAVRSFKKIGYDIFVTEIIETGGRLVFSFIILLLGFKLIGITFAYLAAAALASVFAFYFLEKKVFPIIKTKVVSAKQTKQLLLYSLPIALSIFLNMIIARTDILMIGYFRSVSETGIYSAALATTSQMLLMPTALLGLFIPVVSELYAKKREIEIKNLFRVVSKWVFFINFPIGVAFILFSKQLLRIIFGQEYTAGYLAFSILIVGYFFFSISLISGNMLAILKKTKLVFVITLTATILNVLLNYFLVPIYGINGGAIATTTSLLFAAATQILFINKFSHLQPFRINFVKAIGSVLIATSIIYLLVYHFPVWLLPNIFRPLTIWSAALAFSIFGFVYTICAVLLFKSLEKEDTEIISAIRKKILAKRA